MRSAREYFNTLNSDKTLSDAQASQIAEDSIIQLRTEIKNSRFALGCAARDDFDFNKTEKYVFNFGPGRKIENLTLYCFQRQLYVLRLPCKWDRGATTSTTDPAGFNTKVFIDGRRLIMSPFMDLREK